MMKNKTRKNFFIILMSSFAVLSVVILIIWKLDEMSLRADTIPPDYIECTVTEVDDKLLLTKVLNDKSIHYESNEQVVLDFSKIRDDQGELLSASEIEKYLAPFQIGDNISVKFTVADSFDSSKRKHVIKVPGSYSINEL